jgi:hypothetical protein
MRAVTKILKELIAYIRDWDECVTEYTEFLEKEILPNVDPGAEADGDEEEEIWCYFRYSPEKRVMREKEAILLRLNAKRK